jgi:hypothetical protein
MANNLLNLDPRKTTNFGSNDFLLDLEFFQNTKGCLAFGL